MTKEEQDQGRTSDLEKGNVANTKEDEKLESQRNKRKKLLLQQAAKTNKRGVCYLSRIPPHMDPLKLRQILSQYGDIQRIYLTPEDPANQVRRKRAGGFRGQEFSEGWVEFTKKNVAKRVVNMLNMEPIGGKKRSSFYYDLWNIKYLSKFKWDDLTEEIAYKTATREQKLALEISVAKRERDSFIKKVDQSRALTSIHERAMKKRKVQQDSGIDSGTPVDQPEPKVVRYFPQTRPINDISSQKKPGISKEILAGVFGGVPSS